MAITKNNWQAAWPAMPVKADTSPAAILGMNTPQLCQLGSDQMGMIGVVAFEWQLKGLVQFLGAPWTPTQCAECGQLAYEECYWFSLAELKQFFTRIKVGRYTSHKNFTPAVFMEFLQDYSAEMLTARYDHYSQQKPKWTPPEEPVSDEVFNEKMAEIMAMLRTPEEISIGEKFGSEDQFEQHRQQMIDELQKQYPDQQKTE